MGAAASLGVSADGAFTARQVKELAGENWDEARFDIECSDVGTVTFKQLSGWAAELKAKEEQQAEEKRAFERMALIELYEKNGGEVWTITNNWCVQGGGVRCMESQPMHLARGPRRARLRGPISNTHMYKTQNQRELA